MNRLGLFPFQGPSSDIIIAEFGSMSPEFSRCKHVSCASYASQCQTPWSHCRTIPKRFLPAGTSTTLSSKLATSSGPRGILPLVVSQYMTCVNLPAPNTGANSASLSTLRGIVTNSLHGRNPLTTRSSLTWVLGRGREQLGKILVVWGDRNSKRCVDIRVPEVPLG